MRYTRKDLNRYVERLSELTGRPLSLGAYTPDGRTIFSLIYDDTGADVFLQKRFYLREMGLALETAVFTLEHLT